MVSLIIPVISLPYQLRHHVIMHEVAVLAIKQGFRHCQVVVPASPVFPTLGLIGQWCCQTLSTLDRSAFSPGEDTWNKNNKKNVTICTGTKDVETSWPSSYTRPHYITPLVSKAWTLQRCGRDYSKWTGISCQRSAARRNNGAKPDDDDTPTVT